MQHVKNKDESPRLDEIDLKILSVLQENGRIANVELAERVHLSPSPCLARVRALERDGFIKKYAALLDPKTLGLGVEAFIQVVLEKNVQQAFNTFEKTIATHPDVLQCYLLAGAPDYLVHVMMQDLEALQKFLTDFLSTIPGVAHMQSSISLREAKNKTALPLPGPGLMSNERAPR